ncbi:MAG: recombinase-like helix-turn-helix domain-containing protein [Alphaproteobacteria bacterium]
MKSIPELPVAAFMRRVVAEIEDARASGANDPGAIADALNARGFTTRKGRAWTAATVKKFLDSPGAKRLGLAE